MFFLWNLLDNVDGISELLIDGEYDFKVLLNNLEVPVDRSRNIIDNREQAIVLGYAAFQRVLSKFGIKEKVLELEKILISLRRR